jgi:16S rRNA (uracil1498-N3)-methyltransferase
MSKFFVGSDKIYDDRIIIDGTDVNHIKNVLRLKVGDKLQVSDSSARLYNCTIFESDASQIILKIDDRVQENNELSVKVTLFQGLPKGDKLELIIQKAVELGIYEIYPVINERTIVKIEPKKIASRVERWNKISEAAAKQSGRSIIPIVHEPLRFNEALKLCDSFDKVLLPYENADGMKYASECIDAAAASEKAAFFIGPEGGFAAKEIELAKEHNINIISLVKIILRTETAGLTVMSLIMLKNEILRGN